MTAYLRPAQPTDAGAAGDILWRFQEAKSWMPKLHSGAETIAFCGALIDRGWVTVAVVDGRVRGFIARDGDAIEALYTDPAARGMGLGQLLIDAAKADCDRLTLSTFEANKHARKFYEGAGFCEIGRGDGAETDERLPVVHYLWTKERAK